MLQGYEDYTNLAKNVKATANASEQHVTTYLDGIIMDYDARNGKITDKIKNDSWLVDTDQMAQALQAKAEGEEEKYAKLMETARSPLFKELLVKAGKQRRDIAAAGYVPPTQVLLSHHNIAAAGDQIVQTAHEIVRQINYQSKVSGVFYRPDKYQAVNAANKISTNDLTTMGAIDLQLPTGHPEISDDYTPEAVRGLFSTFSKQIFADSFHYGFGMREASDAWFDIKNRMTSKVSGLMLKMKNDKLVAALKAVNSKGQRNWKVLQSGHDIVANDASEIVEDAHHSLEDFEGPVMTVANRKTIRAYERNVMGRNVTATKTHQSAGGRQGTFEFNPELRYYVENEIGDGELIALAKDQWCDHYIGPEIDISYKDRMKPSEWEGRIAFHFNGIKVKIGTAATRFTGLTSGTQ